MLLSILTPFFFTSGNVTIRRLDEMDFKAEQISHNPVIVMNFFVLVIGIIYWNSENPMQKFDPKLFLFGAIGSAIC